MNKLALPLTLLVLISCFTSCKTPTNSSLKDEIGREVEDDPVLGKKEFVYEYLPKQESETNKLTLKVYTSYDKDTWSGETVIKSSDKGWYLMNQAMGKESAFLYRVPGYSIGKLFVTSEAGGEVPFDLQCNIKSLFSNKVTSVDFGGKNFEKVGGYVLGGSYICNINASIYGRDINVWLPSQSYPYYFENKARILADDIKWKAKDSDDFAVKFKHTIGTFGGDNKTFRLCTGDYSKECDIRFFGSDRANIEIKTEPQFDQYLKVLSFKVGNIKFPKEGAGAYFKYSSDSLVTVKGGELFLAVSNYRSKNEKYKILGLNDEPVISEFFDITPIARLASHLSKNNSIVTLQSVKDSSTLKAEILPNVVIDNY